MIECEHVYKQYKNGTNALYDVNFSVKQGEFVYIIGPTGSGKSTLIKLLDGEELPTKGNVEVVGINVGELKRKQVPIAYALEVINMKKPQIKKRVDEVLDVVSLKEKKTSFPHELSGGQQQRIAIARAIANRPKVLIADEPTGNLDPGKSDQIMNLLERINKRYGTTILMVTHDLTLVNKHRKRTVVLEHGHIVADLAQGGYVRHDQ